MIGCYISGVLPRPKELIDATRGYDRGRVEKATLNAAFEQATLKAINTQATLGFSYVTDGMLKWQDLLRPFAENLDGVRTGGLARWFNNNTFYRKPVIVSKVQRKRTILQELTFLNLLPKNAAWKAIVPAPYTFAELSENQFYKNKTELMFDYAKALRQEIRDLSRIGFEYIQLSDPALVYHMTAPNSRDKLVTAREAVGVALKGLHIKSCLHTFFGDFSRILPEAAEFQVDDLGVDLYATDIEKLKQHDYRKGVVLGLADSRSSLVEDESEMVKVAKHILSIFSSLEVNEIFVCPNCDLDFLPYDRAKEKMNAISHVTKLLQEEFGG